MQFSINIQLVLNRRDVTLHQLKDRRRSQVAKAEVCKTFIQRFKSARRLHFIEFTAETQRRRGKPKINHCLHDDASQFPDSFLDHSRHSSAVDVLRASVPLW